MEASAYRALPGAPRGEYHSNESRFGVTSNESRLVATCLSHQPGDRCDSGLISSLPSVTTYSMIFTRRNPWRRARTSRSRAPGSTRRGARAGTGPPSTTTLNPKDPYTLNHNHKP